MGKKKRIIVRNAFIQKFTGTGRRQASRILDAIRKSKKKDALQPVTTFDVAEFYGLNEDDVRKEMEDEG